MAQDTFIKTVMEPAREIRVSLPLFELNERNFSGDEREDTRSLGSTPGLAKRNRRIPGSISAPAGNRPSS